MFKMALVAVGGLGAAVCYFHAPDVWAHVVAHMQAWL